MKAFIVAVVLSTCSLSAVAINVKSYICTVLEEGGVQRIAGGEVENMTLSRPPPHYLLKQNINGTWSVGNNTVPRFRANCEVAAKGIFLCSMTGQATFDMFIEKNKRTVFHVGFETGVYATPATNDMNKLDIPSSGDSMLYTASGTCEDQ